MRLSIALRQRWSWRRHCELGNDIMTATSTTTRTWRPPHPCRGQLWRLQWRCCHGRHHRRVDVVLHDNSITTTLALVVYDNKDLTATSTRRLWRLRPKVVVASTSRRRRWHDQDDSRTTSLTTMLSLRRRWLYNVTSTMMCRLRRRRWCWDNNDIDIVLKTSSLRFVMDDEVDATTMTSTTPSSITVVIDDVTTSS